MPRPPETPDIRASKTLAYILRHGAEKEQLEIRSDGYLRLTDVLGRPKMKDVNLEMVLRLVEENAKQRFELFYGFDPSPPKPKKTKGKGKGKSKLAPNASSGGASGMKDEKTIEDGLAAATISEPVEPSSTELPLVALDTPPPIDEQAPLDTESEVERTHRGEYFIRARQGHSIHLESTDHLTPVFDDEEGKARAGELVHGTRWELWDIIKQEGLSKMSRQHIHLAPSLTGKITPRPTSTLYIHLSLPLLVSPPKETMLTPIPLFTSSNGVILSPGDEHGTIGSERFERVVRAERPGGRRWIVWEGGKEVERLEDERLDVIEVTE